MRALILMLLVAVAVPTQVYAQGTDVPALIKLIENQPNDMDRSTWKEKRRDAARKLAQSKDKRAVPVLTNLAETETFDIIGDIAIEGLGTLKDQAAVPVLQRIVADSSRDKSSRDLARKALAKLGAPETGSAGGGTGSGSGSGSGSATSPSGGGTSGGVKTGGGAKTGGGTTTTVTTGGGATTSPTGGGAKTGGGNGGGAGATTGGGGAGSGGAVTSGGSGSGEITTVLEGGGSIGGGGAEASGGGLISDKPASDVEGQPPLADDVIAAWDRLTRAAGTASLSYDTARKRSDFELNATGLWSKRVEAETKAYGFNLGADLLAGQTNPDGRGLTRAIMLNLHGDAEARFYSNKLYGVGKTAIGSALSQFTYRDQNDPANDYSGSDGRVFTADLQIALGGGYGRIVDVGSAIRVARLARLLDSARALGKPIDAATSRKLQLTWWALRGERSSFRSLIATIEILREAGILLGEPNAVITYEILQVLRDTQLYMRPSGLDVQIVFGEGFLYRPNLDDNPDSCDVGSARCGRYEQVIASAGYGSQLDEDRLELSGNAYARYRLFPGEGNAAPWALGATARMRRFMYLEHGDPFGALDLRGTLALSTDANPGDPCMGEGCDTSLRIEGELGFTYWFNQASGLRLSANLAEDAGEIFFGARLEATYGLLDGTFAR